MVVVVLPSPKFLLQVVQRDEFTQIKEFITQSTVERFDKPIIGRLAGARVIELDAVSVCPVVQRPRLNSVPLSTVIALGQPRRTAERSSA
ncbi:hypothetical protein D3C86_570920 [compost metagenome]